MASQFTAAPFSGRDVLVTGGTSGIGRAVAIALIAEGARVTLTGRDGADCDAAAADAELASATIMPLDVRDEAAVAGVLARFEGLDILVNCAGMIRRQAEFDPAIFTDVIDVNLNGTMRLCLAARPLLAARQGAIVNTASMLSFFGSGAAPAYAASKGGVAQLSKSLAIAFAGESIRVNAVAPGWIATPLTQALQDDPARAAPILARTPMRRWGKPAEVADAVLFLCSPLARFVTGAVLTVDGGYSVA